MQYKKKKWRHAKLTFTEQIFFVIFLSSCHSASKRAVVAICASLAMDSKYTLAVFLSNHYEILRYSAPHLLKYHEADSIPSTVRR